MDPTNEINKNLEALNMSSNEASQTQRRNKKRKPPNYYQNPEYQAILKTSELENIINEQQKFNESKNGLNETSNEVALIVNEDLKEPVVKLEEEVKIEEIKIEELPQKNDPQPEFNDPKTELEEEIKNNEEQTSPQLAINEPLVVSDINSDEINKPVEKTETIVESSGVKENIEMNEKNTQAVLSSNVSSNSSNGNGNQVPTGKSWSSLFKSRTSANSSTTQTTNTTPQTTSPINTTNKQQQKQASKSPLGASVSLPISSGAYLNGTSSAADSSDLANISATASTSDVLKILGNLFKQCELKHSAPALQPRGIKNKQNWCYINATLQALLACPPFYNLIKQIYMKIKSSNTSVKNVPLIASLGRYVMEFKTMVRPQSTSSASKELIIGEPLEIDYFYETLIAQQNEAQFKSGRQEDAQEFLSFLLNRLHEEMVKCLDSLNPNLKASDEKLQQNGGQSDSTGRRVEEEEDDDEWKEVGKKNKAFITRKTEFKQSPLSDIFCGQFRTALSQPGFKDKESISLEPFFTIPLDIQSDSIRTVQQALDHFVQREEVYGLTNQEKQEIEAYKRISFEDLPPVLILYLKCFVYDKLGGIQKLNKRIDFQIDLEISKELISPNQRSKLREKRRVYKLFAVEYHHGDKATGGHYITDAYHPGITGWVRYDDANVTKVNNTQVLKSEDKKLIPYLLYYRRADLI